MDVFTAHGCIEESEVYSRSLILSVSYLCLFCVSNGTKGVVSTAKCGITHREGKRKGGGYTDRCERMQKIGERQRARVAVCLFF